MAKKQQSSLATSGKRKRSTGVPGTYRGFSLQANRFLVYLLKAEMDETVSLEAFDDVGVESPSGKRTAEQNKSFLSQNPLADRSPQLWKTFSNWVEAAKSKELLPESTKYILYAPGAVPGTVVSALNAAKDAEQVSKALQTIRKHLGYPDSLSESVETRNQMLCVLDADSTMLHPLIANFTLESGSIVGTEEIVKLFSTQLIGPESQEETINWAHGWVKTQIDRQVAANKPCFIVKRDFHEALRNYVRHHDRLTILKSFAGEPDASQVQAEIELRSYVRQLRCIELDELDVLSAVNDYLRAAVDRTHWSEEGYINVSALEQLASELTQTWKHKLRRVSIAHVSQAEHFRGQVLYSDCMEHTTKLDHLETPPHFIRGSWHVLADECEIGWHPRFKDLLSSNVSGESLSKES